MEFSADICGNVYDPMNGFKKKHFLKNLPLMKPSPILPNRLKTCPQGDFDMLKWNLTSKSFDSATQTSKLRKTTSICFYPITGLHPAQVFYEIAGLLRRRWWWGYSTVLMSRMSMLKQSQQPSPQWAMMSITFNPSKSNRLRLASSLFSSFSWPGSAEQ